VLSIENIEKGYINMKELRNTQAYSPPGRLDWPTEVVKGDVRAEIA
jgi:hypothetical protein